MFLVAIIYLFSIQSFDNIPDTARYHVTQDSFACRMIVLTKLFIYLS